VPRPAAAETLAALARAAPQPCYLLYGEEPFLVARALAIVRGQLVPPNRPGAWRVLWADEDADRLHAAIADLASPLLFGGPGVLVVRHAEALDERGQEALLAALPGLGRGAHVVLVGGAVDLRRRVFAACVRAGSAWAFPPLDLRGAEARDWAVRLARERGHEIAPAAVEELLARVGADLGALDGEIEKASLHAGPGTRLDVGHVRAVVARVRAHASEELSDRLARRDIAGALALLRRLLAEGEPPLRLVAFLASNLRRALHVAELVEAGLPAEEIARRLGMPPWLVARNVGRGTARGLAEALRTLRRLDRSLKASRPAAAVFEASLLEVAGGGRPT
jgi:DNA polymerase-3 subunit delta